MHDKNYNSSGYELWHARYSALECLAWTEHDENEDYLDSLGLDFDEASKALLQGELTRFITDNNDDLHGLSYGQIGHDFILTRNGPGGGFWGSGLGDARDRLTDSAKTYGSITAFVLDGKLRAERC